jgi:hypothetical protein
MDTPWYVPQPHGVAIDLLLPNDENMAQTEKHCRETPRKIGEDLLLTRFPTRSTARIRPPNGSGRH